jgi:excisionase family DNA binding protein
VVRNLEKARYVSVIEGEELTGLSRWTLRRWYMDGKISSIKVGSRVLIPMSEIDRVIAEGTRPRLAEAVGA